MFFVFLTSQYFFFAFTKSAVGFLILSVPPKGLPPCKREASLTPWLHELWVLLQMNCQVSEVSSARS